MLIFSHYSVENLEAHLAHGREPLSSCMTYVLWLTRVGTLIVATIYLQLIQN